MIKPYFTICIPSYNRSRMLRKSITELKNQTFKNFEVIVVDDGSNDDTFEMIEEFNENNNLHIRYFFQKNSGKYIALNKGIQSALGKYFIVLDSDEYLAKDALFRMYSMISSSKKDIGVIGKSAKVDGKIIGDMFSDTNHQTSYIDFHFNNRYGVYGKKYGDCCECNLTAVLQKNLFPEVPDVKFIPESFMFNRVGLSENLITTNQVFKYIEYQEDGITKNYKNGFQEQNYLGYLYDYVDDINHIFRSAKINILPKFIIWMKYWHMKSFDEMEMGPKASYLSIIGFFAKILYKPVYALKKSKVNVSANQQNHID